MLDKFRLFHFLPERAVFIPGLEADKDQTIIFNLYFLFLFLCNTSSFAMGYLNIYFNDELNSKHQMSALITRIGRHQNSDVVIDNAGVSGNHAEIVRNGDQDTIHDLDSKNGVYANGQRISKKELKFGDEIIIFKHRPRFIWVDLPVAVVPPDSTASSEKKQPVGYSGSRCFQWRSH